MSSVSQHQQHLTSADMNMRAHQKVCAKIAIMAEGLDVECIAAFVGDGLVETRRRNGSALIIHRPREDPIS